jgi:hypothetical protein
MHNIICMMKINLNHLELNHMVWKKKSKDTVASLTSPLQVRGSGSVMFDGPVRLSVFFIDLPICYRQRSTVTVKFN